MKITPPLPTQHPDFYQRYIDAVKGDDLIEILSQQRDEGLRFMKAIPDEKANYSYADGKWSVKEVLIHIIDAERVFAYRAMRFARNDKTPLPGFEEDDYAPESFAALRTIESIAGEYAAVRSATIELFKTFNAEQIDRAGMGNNRLMAVRSLGYAIAGHQQHHLKVLREKYLL